MKKTAFPFAISFITLLGFAIRLAYALNAHPFIDEFTTVLAARSILERGLPILPSGLFYEHGMAFSYLAAPFVAVANQGNLFTIARLPSLLISAAAIPLIYYVGKRWFSVWVGLGSALLLALSPEGMVWGGRARMYGLTQFLILLLAYLVYEGSVDPRKTKQRWLALLVLLLALLAQFGALMYIPPLVIAVAVVVWRSRDWQTQPFWAFLKVEGKSWFLQGLGLGLVMALAMLVKRLGRPIGMAQIGETATANPIAELWSTVAYQIGLALNAQSALDFLARQFGVPHHFWLAVAAVIGLVVFVVTSLMPSLNPSQKGGRKIAPSPGEAGGRRAVSSPGLGWGLGSNNPKSKIAYLFLWLAFGLVIVEMITLLEPFRRNPRYVVMGLPLFYLIVAQSVALIVRLPSIVYRRNGRRTEDGGRTILISAGVIITLFIILHAPGWWKSLQIAYKTPEPPYDLAFQYVAQNRQTNDAVLTMNTSAAALYLDRVDYFAIQDDAEQFLLNAAAEPVDRWLGIPWLGSTAQLAEALNAHSQLWFVVDEQRLRNFGFYRGDWLAMINSQMELAWAQDGALVFKSRADRPPLVTTPAVALEAEFGNQIALTGYTLDTAHEPPHLTLFWRSLAPAEGDYSVFIHLRDANNANAAQWDRRPLDGQYPTSQWQPGESLADSIPLPLPEDLPPGNYRLALGLYRLDTLERLPLRDDVSGENAVLIEIDRE